MKNFKKLSLVGLLVFGLCVVAGNSWALNWAYQYDSYSDASGGVGYEVYRMGYAFDQDNVYINLWTGLPKTGRTESITHGNVAPGDLYLNVGGSQRAGYTGTGVTAQYAAGNVFGLALTGHAGEMNNDMYHATYYPTKVDDGYSWSPVVEGHLYSQAMFSTGVYEAYAGAKTLGADGKQLDGGKDPFGGENNAPVHIAQFGADLGSQGPVSWAHLGNVAVATGVVRDVYEVNAVVSLRDLGIKGGEKIEMGWSMECGNDFFIMDPITAPARPAVPEPTTLLLLGLGLLGLGKFTRKVRV